MRVIDKERFRHALETMHATESAPLLLGATLILGELRAEIVEVEAYGGKDDPGSHAFGRQTTKNRTMFSRPGLAYVYISYGMHMMLNVVARPEGEGSAVLIRAARPVTGTGAMFSRRPKAKLDRDLLSGPGKLCQAFGIDKGHDATDLLDANSSLRIEFSNQLVDPLVSRRIGIAPGKGDELEWRFVHPEHRRYASRP